MSHSFYTAKPVITIPLVLNSRNIWWQEQFMKLYIIIIIIGSQPLVGPGLLKKLCPFVSVEGELNPLQCHPWQIGPAFTS
jgi:hypothetical protein